MLNFTTVIADESRLFAEAIRLAPPEAPVPTCPEWSVSDLAWHLTEVHSFWARILSSGAVSDDEAGPVEESVPPRPESLEQVLSLYDKETAELLTQLEHRSDPEPAWFWLDTHKTVGATRRMQAHEATMHRIDAQLAGGHPVSAVSPGLAADGLRHVLEVMWAWWGTVPNFTFVSSGAPIRLAPSDSGSILVETGRWQGVGQSGKNYDVPSARITDAGEPTASVNGNAEQIYRWLWGRGDEPTMKGEASALEALRAAQQQGMQ